MSVDTKEIREREDLKDTLRRISTLRVAGLSIADVGKRLMLSPSTIQKYISRFNLTNSIKESRDIKKKRIADKVLAYADITADEAMAQPVKSRSEGAISSKVFAQESIELAGEEKGDRPSVVVIVKNYATPDAEPKAIKIEVEREHSDADKLT